MKKYVYLGMSFGVAVLLITLAIVVRFNRGADAPPKPEPYTRLKIDCPDKRGVEAVYRDGALVASGIWALQIGTESVRFKPPADCWVLIGRMPDAYDKGDKIRLLGFEPAKVATGSGK